MRQIFRSLLIVLMLLCANQIFSRAQNTGIIQANNRGKYGVCSSSGQWIISPRYESILLFSHFYICSSGDEYFFYDSDGNSKDDQIRRELRAVSWVDKITDYALLVGYQGYKKALLDHNLSIRITEMTGIDPFAGTHLRKYGIAYGIEDKKYGVFDSDFNILIRNYDEIKIEQDVLRCRTGSYWESFDLSNGASEVKERLKKRSQQASVQRHIDEGDKLFRQERYWDAAMAYSQAIEKGYKNYQIYYKRASAFYNNEFYKNAIEDFTNALSFEENPKSYLYRGLAKLRLNDYSGVEDLKKGGPEGMALAKEYMPIDSGSPEGSYVASGTGFFIDSRGFIATNYHVIDGAKKIDVFITKNGQTNTYSAKSVVVDKSNDLAIVKVTDDTYSKLSPVPYLIGSGTKDVGTAVFAMGYPELSHLGEEIKVTDGIISSKTGYQGDITTYQISAPIQHGNSGGPLFDKNGSVIGITNAGVESLQNVGYAIKVSYLNNLIEACPESINMPTSNQLSGLSFPEKIKKISPYVVIIKIY